MKTNTYGDIAVELVRKTGYNNFDCGTPDELHQIFDEATKRGMKKSYNGKYLNQHPLNIHQRVLNALDRDERFSKGTITYPGIYKKPVRSFRLKNEHIGHIMDD